MSLRKLKRTKAKKSRKTLSSQYGTADIDKLFQVAQGYLQSGNQSEAEKIYRKIIKAFPDNASAHNDLGTLYHSLGEIEKAITHYEKAIAIDGNNVQALTNYGLILLGQGNFDEALDAYQKVIAVRPDFVEAHYGMGLVLKGKGRPAEAITSFKKVLGSEPGHLGALRNLGITYAEQEEFDEAVKVYEKLVVKEPGNLNSLNKLGILYQKCGNLDQAIVVFKKVLAVDPEYLAARFSLAEALEHYNKIDAAYTEVLDGLDHIPGEPSLLALAATCERRLGKFDTAIGRLAGIKIDQLDVTNQRQCFFELARLYDRVGEYDKAYQCFTSGNQVSQKINENADKGYFLDRMTLLQQQFQKCDFIPEADPSLKGRAPVFLVGFPRSGTTLLDQILDSHTSIQTMEEKDIVFRLEQKVVSSFDEYVQQWQKLPVETISALQEAYYHEVAEFIQVKQGQILIDRMPLNTMRAALIYRIFPDAKFILAIRHPLDVCLSCFMQDFRINTANANFFTLQDAAFFYAGVMDLWRLYVAKIPLNVHMVRYEDLVADLEGQARSTLGFLDLEWDEKTLAFHEHAREKGQIKTASYHQVSQPLYKDAAYRWQRYEKYCEPIREMLTPYIEYFGYKDES